MAWKSFFETFRIILASLLTLLIIPITLPQPPSVRAAEPMVLSQASREALPAAFVENRRGMNRVGAPQIATRHILLHLHPRANEARFLQNASAQGLRRLGRVYGSNWLTMSIPAGADPRQASAAARMLPGVLQATTDPIVRINDQIPPRDPIYQYDDDPSTKPCDPLFDICDPWDLVDQWGLFQVEAEGGWVVQRGSQQVVIAILDSGIDLDHDDLWANIWTNPGEVPGNGIDDDGNGLIDDVHGADFAGDNVGAPSDNPGSQDGNPDIAQGGAWVEDLTAYPFGIRFAGDPAVGDAVDNNFDLLIDPGVFHGTFVAGVAGAMTDNFNLQTQQYEGMAGVCWHCKLMPVRFINAEGTGFGSDAAAAINYAVAHGAHIINASWGIDLNFADPSEIQVIAQAIDNAVSRGVIVVAAAGNSGTSGLHFPASMANTIAVGSSNWLDRRSDFSSFAAPGEIPDNGIDDDGNGWVDDVLDVVAPGELIWSAGVFSAYDELLYDFLGIPGVSAGTDTYFGADGTSFATPLVSGYAGLILSHNPGATPSQIRQAIRSNAMDLLDPNGVGQSLVGYDAYTGFGRMRMVVPTLTIDPNQVPVADAGTDQTVADTGKPGMEKITLTGSGSYDPDGSIISYQWLEDGIQIATGATATVNLPVGLHTITLRVTDDKLASSTDQVTVQITKKSGDAPGGGTPTAMGVYAIDWFAKNNLDARVNVRRDSNGSNGLDNGDAPVSGARVTLVITYDSNADGIFDCSGIDNCWTFVGDTDSSGNLRVKLLQAPAGNYQGRVAALTHSVDYWDQTLDRENPETFGK